MPRAPSRPACLRCRRALSRVFASEEVRVERPNLFGGVDVSARTVRGEMLGYGYAKTGLFCSLTCGHWWAVDQFKRDKDKGDGPGILTVSWWFAKKVGWVRE